MTRDSALYQPSPWGIGWEHDAREEAFMVQALREGALTQMKGVVK